MHPERNGMALEFDHVFVCVNRGAPEAEAIRRFGLSEGPANTHPGQGTANRRFFFRNAMLELLWVEDAREAQSEETAVTKLWERWSQRNAGACPFGVILRPADAVESRTELPFAAQRYQPRWLSRDLEVYVAPADLKEPMWAVMPFLRQTHHEQRFKAHPNGAREVTRLTLCSPVPWASEASRAAEKAGIRLRSGLDYLLTVELDGGTSHDLRDFRPSLPLVAHL